MTKHGQPQLHPLSQRERAMLLFVLPLHRRLELVQPEIFTLREKKLLAFLLPLYPEIQTEVHRLLAIQLDAAQARAGGMPEIEQAGRFVHLALSAVALIEGGEKPTLPQPGSASNDVVTKLHFGFNYLLAGLETKLSRRVARKFHEKDEAALLTLALRAACDEFLVQRRAVQSSEPE